MKGMMVCMEVAMVYGGDGDGDGDAVTAMTCWPWWLMMVLVYGGACGWQVMEFWLLRDVV
ncbi:hypothetical protein HanRHA438_Chr11g0502861 [Helianthus annuus]|nr:hypothetical protein HanHA300_Chr11g0401721 [Helianthus annuus]KAJ0517427.1 hypothetical protein HanHA89_Chr11g0425221 [Helianthus annuus]KAJ0685437.1 hypothetical protein HanLR1_Chr11g0402661 [Helianthus annuus]KAJ0689333.1 hypothetical protein HanOQP8_Chr11g0404521 [Helianthus annuus]KAJ0734518.1 hypothetical protein HanPI659440_Chr11g0421011 [Helianthus annuus]